MNINNLQFNESIYNRDVMITTLNYKIGFEKSLFQNNATGHHVIIYQDYLRNHSVIKTPCPVITFNDIPYTKSQVLSDIHSCEYYRNLLADNSVFAIYTGTLLSIANFALCYLHLNKNYLSNKLQCEVKNTIKALRNFANGKEY